MTQPWWERMEEGCRYSTTQSMNCRTVVGEDGKPQRKCERLMRKLKICPGKPPEEVESRSEEIIDNFHTPLSGAQSSGSFSSSFSSSESGGSLSSGGSFPFSGGSPPFPFLPDRSEQGAEAGAAKSGRGELDPNNPFNLFEGFFSDLAHGMNVMDKVTRVIEEAMEGRTAPGAGGMRPDQATPELREHMRRAAPMKDPKTKYDRFKKDFEEA